MSNKITEVIIEPTTIYTGDRFRLKVKAIRGLTFNELKTLTYTQAMNYTFGELKGE